MKRKNVQIPMELFGQLIKYHLLDIKDQEIEKTINTALERKLTSLQEHELYTTYKTAVTEEKREGARNAYLDSKGMVDAFRY